MPVTTSTEYGRAKILIPDFQHEPGNTLHSKLVGTFGDKYGFETISDYLNSVWYNFVNLPNMSTQNIVHNFNLSYTSNELLVMIWVGGARQTKAQISTNFVIAQVDSNTISVQNISGGPLTFQIMVMSFQVATYIQKILQVFPGAGFGIDTEEGGILEIGHTLATDLNLGRSNQYQELKGRASLVITTDSTTTGSNATLTAPSTSFVRLTNVSLSSIDMIPAPTKAQLLVLTNATGNSISINDETGATASNRIRTGTGGSSIVPNNGSIWLVYDFTSSRWRIVGGSGGGASGSFTIANNITSASSITGLALDSSNTRAGFIDYSVYRSTSTQGVAQAGKIMAVYNTFSTSWDLTDTAVGNAGVVFTITSSGQLQYTSSDLSGSGYSGTMKWKITNTTEI